MCKEMAKRVSIFGNTRVVFPEMYWKFGTKKSGSNYYMACRRVGSNHTEEVQSFGSGGMSHPTS